MTRAVVGAPAEFYGGLEPRGSYRFPLAYAAAAALLGGVVVGAVAFTLNLTTVGHAARAGALFTVAVGLWLYVAHLLQTAVAHGVLVLSGERGFQRTVEAMAYPSVLTLSFALLPLVNIGAAVYGLYLQAKGLAALHDVSGAQAGVAAVAGAVVSAVLMVGASVGLAMVAVQIGSGM